MAKKKKNDSSDFGVDPSDLKDFAKSVLGIKDDIAKAAREFKAVRDFTDNMVKTMSKFKEPERLVGVIRKMGDGVKEAADLMNIYESRSLSARFAIDELNSGTALTASRQKYLNTQVEKFNKLQKTAASDDQIRQEFHKGLGEQMENSNKKALAGRIAMLNMTGKEKHAFLEYMEYHNKDWKLQGKSFEQLQKAAQQYNKELIVEDERLRILEKRKVLEEGISKLEGINKKSKSEKDMLKELLASRKNLNAEYEATGGEASFYDKDTRKLKSYARMQQVVLKYRETAYKNSLVYTTLLGEAEQDNFKQEAINLKYSGGYHKHILDTQFESLGVLGKQIVACKKFLKSIKLIPLPFVLMDMLLKSGIDRFVKLDEAAEKFRRETGFSNTQMVQLRKNAEEVNVELQEFGVNIEDAYAAAGALTEIFGNTALVSKEAMTNVALMSANLGVAAKDSAEVLATFQGLGGASQETAMNVMKVGAGLSEKAGVPFKKVMEDIANASGETLAMLGANPSKLMKSSIAARALGTDMNKLVSAQSKLLDYSTSINSELEASALLGRSVSFQRARQLAYEGDIAGSAKATLETVRKAGDFNKMNMYQRKALAEASGMDLKDLKKMMAVEEQRKKIKLSGTPEEQARLKMQTEALEILEKENDLSKKSLLDENKAAIRQKKMQGLMTQLKNTFESIMVAVGDVLEPIITSLATVVVPLFKIIAAVLRVTIIPLLKLAAYPLEFIGKLLAKGAETLNEWGNKINKLKEESKGFFAFFDDGIGQWIKMAAGLLGMGLFGFLLFGKSGASGLMSAAGKVLSVINPLNIAKNFKSAGKAVGGFFGKIKEGGIRSLFKKSASIPSSAEAAADKTSDVAIKSKDVKSGSGIKDFLTNLADGLKKMGGSGVAKGAFNLLIASPGLITIIPGAVLAGLIPKKAGDNIESFLTGLASGLKAMGTGRITGGAANLLLASVGLITIIPGAIAAAVIGIIGKPIETGLKYLAKGIAYMGDTNVFKGALGIAAVGLSIIPFAFAMQMFSDVDWGAVGIGSLALIGFTAAAFGLGAILSSGVGAAIFGAGVVGIAYLGLALIPFAAAALIAGAGVKMLGEGIASSVDPILRLSEIDLTKAALGIGAIGIALAAFGAGSASAGLGSFVGGLLGGDPIAKMEKLASIGDKLKITAESITSIAQATSQFKAMDAFSESVTKLATSLGKLNDQISETNILKFAALTAMTSTAAATATTATTTQTQTPSGNMAGVEAKLDKLTELLVGGAVRVYLDGKNVSSRVANGYGS
jgi:hypothetical protein